MADWGIWHWLIVVQLGIGALIFLFLAGILTFVYIRWTYGINTKFRLKFRPWKICVDDVLDQYEIRAAHIGIAHTMYTLEQQWGNYKRQLGEIALVAFFGGIPWVVVFLTVVGVAKVAGWLLKQCKNSFGKKFLVSICLTREERAQCALGVGNLVKDSKEDKE